MSAITNFAAVGKVIDIFQAGRVTSDQTADAGVDISGLEGDALVILSITSVSGTNPTWDGKLQEADAVSGTFSDVAGGGFTQVTGTSDDGLFTKVVRAQDLKKALRLYQDVGGTSPVHDVHCCIVGIEKYRS